MKKLSLLFTIISVLAGMILGFIVYDFLKNPFPSYTSLSEAATPTPDAQDAAAPVATPAPEKNPNAVFKVELLSLKQKSGYVILTFRIKNINTEHTFQSVQVKASLLDSRQNVLASEWTYAVGIEKIHPGDSQEFEILIKEPSSAKFAYAGWEVLGYTPADT